MDFVKKCKKRVWACSKRRLHPDEDTASSGSYGKLSEQKTKKPQVKVAPQGCLAVYVGQERQRFVIKVKFANHPLFETLLEAAENEYGYRNDGPLWLPCDVNLFCEALGEMESQGNDMGGSVGCITFPNKGHSHRHSSSTVHALSRRSNIMSYADYQLLV